MTDGPRTLIYDIETSPNLAWIWGKWEQNAIAFEEEWLILSISWKWLGESEIYSDCIGDHWSNSQADGFDDYEVVFKLHELFNEADIVVAHNGNRFDQKKARARMIYWGLEPPSPFREVDTLQIAKRHFAFTSNRLDDLCQYLQIPGKIETGGFSTWLGCLRGEAGAWAKLVRYNRNDVRILERLYKKLRPWTDSHPNVALMTDEMTACPKCGVKGKMTLQGWRYHAVTKRRRYQCQACGGWAQGRVVERGANQYQ